MSSPDDAAAPRLVALPDTSETSEASQGPEAGSPSPAAPQAPAPAGPEPGSDDTVPRKLFLAVLILLLLCAIGFALQTRRATGLAGQVATLEGQVVDLQARVAAADLALQTYEVQRGQVQQAVGSLVESLMALQQLVRSDPQQLLQAPGETATPVGEGP